MTQIPNNILVTNRHRVEIHPGIGHGHTVLVRYNYVDGGDGRLIADLPDRFDPNAKSQIGTKGAFVRVPNVDGIRAAIAELRAIHGDLPVQDNSGLLPEFAGYRFGGRRV